MKFVFIVFLSVFSTVIVAKPSNKNGIEVIGKASVKAEPDQYIFTVEIKERGAIASKTKAIVNQKSKLVSEMYRSMGIAKNAIDSARLQLTPLNDEQRRHPDFEIQQRLAKQRDIDSSKGNYKINALIDSNQLAENFRYKQAKIYFEVSHIIKVTFADVNLYEQLLDNLIKIGVSHIYPLQVSITKNESLYQQALIQALKNANQKAQVIAKQIGVKLGKLSSFKESSYHIPNTYIMQNRSNDSYISGIAQQSVSAQVSATFSIKEDN